MFDPSRWDLQAVESCLNNYAELQEAYMDSFIGSSLRTAGETVSRGSSRVYPARMNLLTSKWDLERGIEHLTDRDQALFYLRFLAHRSQRTIARRLDLSQQHVSRLLRTLPQKIYTFLRGDE